MRVSTEGSPVRLAVTVRGRVQGVGFRYWVRGLAAELGLRGSAVNLPGGDVQIVVEGPRPSCERLLAALRSDGPRDRPPGLVLAVVEQWAPATGLTGFRVG